MSNGLGQKLQDTLEPIPGMACASQLSVPKGLRTTRLNQASLVISPNTRVASFMLRSDESREQRRVGPNTSSALDQSGDRGTSYIITRTGSSSLFCVQGSSLGETQRSKDNPVA